MAVDSEIKPPPIALQNDINKGIKEGYVLNVDLARIMADKENPGRTEAQNLANEAMERHKGKLPLEEIIDQRLFAAAQEVKKQEQGETGDGIVNSIEKMNSRFKHNGLMNELRGEVAREETRMKIRGVTLDRERYVAERLAAQPRRYAEPYNVELVAAGNESRDTIGISWNEKKGAEAVLKRFGVLPEGVSLDSLIDSDTVGDWKDVPGTSGHNKRQVLTKLYDNTNVLGVKVALEFIKEEYQPSVQIRSMGLVLDRDSVVDISSREASPTLFEKEVKARSEKYNNGHSEAKEKRRRVQNEALARRRRELNMSEHVANVLDDALFSTAKTLPNTNPTRHSLEKASDTVTHSRFVQAKRAEIKVLKLNNIEKGLPEDDDSLYEKLGIKDLNMKLDDSIYINMREPDGVADEIFTMLGVKDRNTAWEVFSKTEAWTGKSPETADWDNERILPRGSDMQSSLLFETAYPGLRVILQPPNGDSQRQAIVGFRFEGDALKDLIFTDVVKTRFDIEGEEKSKIKEGQEARGDITADSTTLPVQKQTGIGAFLKGVLGRK